MKEWYYKLLLTLFSLIGMFLTFSFTSYASDYTIQDNNLTLYGGTRISDSTASDGYCTSNINNDEGWNIQYINWDFSYLEPGELYDVYARVKVRHNVSNPTGNAFKLGIYDSTSNNLVLPERIIASADTADLQWKEYKIGTFKPNSGVNNLLTYVAGTGNSAQISHYYVDYVVFKKHSTYVIEDSSFDLYNGAVRQNDGLTMDNSTARMLNGSGGQWNIQAIIDGSKIEPDAQYEIRIRVLPEIVDWYTSTGDIFGYCVYDFTAAAYVINPTVVNSSSLVKRSWYYQIECSPVSINPTHSVRICFYQVNNTLNFPAFSIDNVALAKTPGDDSIAKSINAYPYKISPANADGYNDTTQIAYTLPSASTTYVRVYNTFSGSLIRTLVNGANQSGYNEVIWDGKDDQGQLVPNSLYIISVFNSSGEIFGTNVQIINGVTLSQPSGMANNYLPKGVWFGGAGIPYDQAAATNYLNSCFSDISNLGADIVFIPNFGSKSTSTLLSTASSNGIKAVVFPDWYTAFNEALFSDETAMYNHINNLTSSYKMNSGLYGYLLYDEPDNNPKLADNLSDIKRVLETVDPNHPVFIDYVGVDRIQMNYSAQKTQSILIDPYPVRENSGIGDFGNICGPGFNYENYLDFTTLQPRKDIEDNARMWTILQTFNTQGWFRDPTPEEVRAMTYEAVGHGSKGFIYFMYQTQQDWEGLVDANYNHRIDYYTCQTLFSEIEVMESTILNMRKIGNVASATGGGNSYYSNADVTTHEDPATGDKFLVVVNHDCINSANISITIDRAKLGMDITGIRNVYDNAVITYYTDSNSYTISNLAFAPGDGKILRLVKDTSVEVYVGQDSEFTLYGNAIRFNGDVSASDMSVAKQTINPYAWNIQWFWDKADLIPGEEYDLYAVVKIKYAQDMYMDSNYDYRLFDPSGYAYSYGVYDFTSSSWVIPEAAITAGSMENMFWHTIKLGSFIPSQTNNQMVYIAPAQNQGNVYEIYIDKFYFIRK